MTDKPKLRPPRLHGEPTFEKDGREKKIDWEKIVRVTGAPPPTEEELAALRAQFRAQAEEAPVAPSVSADPPAERRAPTPWAVICPVHGRVYLTRDEYMAGLQQPNDPWRCPIEECRKPGVWDDEWHAAMTEDEEEPWDA